MAELSADVVLKQRVDAVRAAAQQEAAEVERQRATEFTARFERASQRLIELAKAELGLAAVPQPVNFHKEYSHGSPEEDYALTKIEPYWIAVRIVPDDPSTEALIGLIHCPNGHVLGLDYPVTDDDTWDRTLLRIDEAQRQYQSTDHCSNCVQARMTVRPYKPAV